MTAGALCYTLYTAGFVLASARAKYSDFGFSKDGIKAVILITAVLNGFGASILWVAQGRYISRVANNKNKGTYNSIFWAFFMSSQLVGSLFAALVLQNTDEFTFFSIMTGICFLASFFFLALQPIEDKKVNDTQTTETEDDGYDSHGIRKTDTLNDEAQ